MQTNFLNIINWIRVVVERSIKCKSFGWI